MGSGDGSGPGHNALKNQVVGFLFAAQYMRGEQLRWDTVPFSQERSGMSYEKDAMAFTTFTVLLQCR